MLFNTRLISVVVIAVAHCSAGELNNQQPEEVRTMPREDLCSGGEPCSPGATEVQQDRKDKQRQSETEKLLSILKKKVESSQPDVGPSERSVKGNLRSAMTNLRKNKLKIKELERQVLGLAKSLQMRRNLGGKDITKTQEGIAKDVENKLREIRDLKRSIAQLYTVGSHYIELLGTPERNVRTSNENRKGRNTHDKRWVQQLIQNIGDISNDVQVLEGEGYHYLKTLDIAPENSYKTTSHRHRVVKKDLSYETEFRNLKDIKRLLGQLSNLASHYLDENSRRRLSRSAKNRHGLRRVHQYIRSKKQGEHKKRRFNQSPGHHSNMHSFHPRIRHHYKPAAGQKIRKISHNKMFHRRDKYGFNDAKAPNEDMHKVYHSYKRNNGDGRKEIQRTYYTLSSYDSNPESGGFHRTHGNQNSNVQQKYYNLNRDAKSYPQLYLHQKHTPLNVHRRQNDNNILHKTHKSIKSREYSKKKQKDVPHMYKVNQYYYELPEEQHDQRVQLTSEGHGRAGHGHSHKPTQKHMWKGWEKRMHDLRGDENNEGSVHVSHIDKNKLHKLLQGPAQSQGSFDDVENKPSNTVEHRYYINKYLAKPHIRRETFDSLYKKLIHRAKRKDKKAKLKHRIKRSAKNPQNVSFHLPNKFTKLNRNSGNVNGGDFKKLETEAVKVKQHWTHVMQQYAAYSRTYDSQLPAVHQQIVHLRRRIERQIQAPLGEMKRQARKVNEVKLQRVRQAMDNINRVLERINNGFHRHQYMKHKNSRGKQQQDQHKNAVFLQNKQPLQTTTEHPQHLENPQTSEHPQHLENPDTMYNRDKQLNQNVSTKYSLHKAIKHSIISSSVIVNLYWLAAGGMAVIAVQVIWYKVRMKFIKKANDRYNQQRLCLEDLNYEVPAADVSMVTNHDEQVKSSNYGPYEFKIPFGSQV